MFWNTVDTLIFAITISNIFVAGMPYKIAGAFFGLYGALRFFMIECEKHSEDVT